MVQQTMEESFVARHIHDNGDHVEEVLVQALFTLLPCLRKINFPTRREWEFGMLHECVDIKISADKGFKLLSSVTNLALQPQELETDHCQDNLTINEDCSSPREPSLVKRLLIESTPRLRSLSCSGSSLFGDSIRLPGLHTWNCACSGALTVNSECLA